MSVRALCHFVVAVHYWFGCYYDWNYVKIPPEVSRMGESFGFSGKLKFLTYWDALLQGFFFTICLLNDIVGTNENVPKKTPFIRKFKDVKKAASQPGLPALHVRGADLLGPLPRRQGADLPQGVGPILPVVAQPRHAHQHHAHHPGGDVHLVQAVPPRRAGVAVLTAFMAVYLAWIHVINSYTGMWVYPVLDVLNLPLRVVFFALLFGFSFSLYVLGERLNGALWGRQLKALKAS
ncbi:hypothetical protein NQ318_003009 [Aromia moschata]|uniref:Uncharacterized protein n=1 Tax=Aromia moschata TaxID=1265417 RepID=A0AAV8YRZ8_9CUCU|nr:hypothetical protein NQ318_003009 [Aromia moschata]